MRGYNISVAVKHIYIVRHGQTDYNRLHKHQLLSTPLNERGLQQAHHTASVLQKIPMDLFISSDEVRAFETASILQSVSNAPLTQNKLFREVQRPAYILGSGFWSVRSILYAIYLYILSGINMWPYKDGENMKAVQARAKRALALLEQSCGKHIVVVSHRLFISAMIAEILGKDVTKAFSHFWTVRSLKTIANGSVIKLSYDSSAENPWTILRDGDTSM